MSAPERSGALLFLARTLSSAELMMVPLWRWSCVCLEKAAPRLTSKSDDQNVYLLVGDSPQRVLTRNKRVHTCVIGSRYWDTAMTLNPKDTWYVAFSIPRIQRTPGQRAVLRVTETFQTEADAKEFARLKVAEGRILNARTLNPHLPKRTVAAAEI